MNNLDNTVRSDLGAVTFTFRGLHSPDIDDYESLNIVNDENEIYYYTEKNVPVGTELNNTEYWNRFPVPNAALVDALNRLGVIEGHDLNNRLIKIEMSVGSEDGLAQLDESGKLVFDQLPDIDKAYVGLGNVEDYAPDDIPISFEIDVELTELTPGEKISRGFGKIAKAIISLKNHLQNDVLHITGAEREKWNAASKYTTDGSIEKLIYSVISITDEIEDGIDEVETDTEIAGNETDEVVENVSDEGDIDTPMEPIEG